MSYFLTPYEFRFNDLVSNGNANVNQLTVTGNTFLEGQVTILGNIYANYIFGNVLATLVPELV